MSSCSLFGERAVARVVFDIDTNSGLQRSASDFGLHERLPCKHLGAISSAPLCLEGIESARGTQSWCAFQTYRTPRHRRALGNAPRQLPQVI